MMGIVYLKPGTCEYYYYFPQPLSSTSKAPARAGEAEAPSPSGFTHWQAQADSAPGVTVGAPGPSGPSHSSFQGPTLRQNVRHP